MKSLKYFTIFLSIITIILTFLSLINGLWWGLEYVANFRHQYLLLQLLLILILLILKTRWHFTAFFSIFILFNLIPIIWLYIPDSNREVKNQLKILLANVNTMNNNYDYFVSYAKKTDPDIIALIEVDSRWIESIKTFEENYHSIKKPRGDNFGIALYSKTPFTSGEIKYYGSLGVPSLDTVISVKGKDIRIILTHPIPPKSKEYMILRNEQLLEIANIIKKDKKRDIIFLGDFNITPWAYNFNKILKVSGLKDSRKGFGFQVTWPTFQPLFYIPIDHCFLDKNFKVLKREIGPHIGSDHYPVVLEMGW